MDLRLMQKKMSEFHLSDILSKLRLVFFQFLLLTSLTFQQSSVSETLKFITLQSTTSTQNSGLYDHLLPIYEKKTGIKVKVVAVGTGQALKNAKNCDGDVVIVHSTNDEEIFVKNGYGTRRYDLMYNDFVIIGPGIDMAGIRKVTTVTRALKLIAKNKIRFASRGDNSGTHKAEKKLWQLAGIDDLNVVNNWYLETGLGMGSTLNFAVQSNAYAITDRATWLAFQNKNNHEILFQGDPPMFNQYGIIPVDSKNCPNVKAGMAQDFTDWIISSEGQSKIAEFQRNGTQLFFPNVVD